MKVIILIALLFSFGCAGSRTVQEHPSADKDIKRLQELIKEAKEHYSMKEYTQAKSTFDKIFSIMGINARIELIPPVTGKDHDAQVKEYIEKLEPVILERTASIQALYEQGVALFNLKQYKASVDYFAKVLVVEPNYRDTIDFITRANEEIVSYVESIADEKERRAKEVEAERRHSQLVKNYNDAVNLYNKGSFESAFLLFKKVLQDDPKYKDIVGYYKKLQQKMSLIATQLYKEGLSEYTDGNINQAIRKWERSLELVPDYPEAKKAIERAKVRLEK